MTMKDICINLFVIYAATILPVTSGWQPNVVSDYMDKRNLVLQNEFAMKTGGNLLLTNKEVQANQKIMYHKLKEINASQINDNFLPSIHFFKARYYIENTTVYKIIKQMPKGAALHLHDTSMVDLNWLVKNATYRDNCYMCYDNEKGLVFKFSKTVPSPRKACEWKLTSDVRKQFEEADFDTWLYNNLTMIVSDPATAYPNQSFAWKRFYEIFGVADGLIFYDEVFKDYFYEALQEFHDDNVQYIEFRGLLGAVHDINGVEHSKEWIVETYRNVSQQFVKDNPDFIGSKFIYSSSRSRSSYAIKSAIKEALHLQKLFPDYFLGYDLVGREDPGHSLKYFLDDLLYPASIGQKLTYFFHAGETNWEGVGVDENLIDALLLNTSRIGHGYALVKHPQAFEMGRAKDVPVEICPISNQVLKLVDDLRNHPAAELLAIAYPVVISSDDPALWGATGLSHDFYEAFMGLGGATADLRFLKQLAINSIKYSAMTDKEKAIATNLWQTKWNTFIDYVIKNF